MKHFSICHKDNTDFFGINLNSNNLFGCITISTKHIGLRGKKYRSPGNTYFERRMLYVIKDLKVRGNDKHTHFIAYYAEYPKTVNGQNPNTCKVHWQKGALQGSCLLENLNACIMSYVDKFYDKIELSRDIDTHVKSGDNVINGLTRSLPTRKEHQQGLLYKSSPQQCNRPVDDNDVRARRPIVHGLHKTITRDENGNLINKSTVAHNRALEAWKAERQAKGLSTDEHIFFEENSLLRKQA